MPQGSKRHVGRGIMVEASKEVGPWRERVALAAHTAMSAAGCDITAGGVAIHAEFILPRPKNTPKRRTPLATKRPDCDKLLRAALDAITNVLITDDAIVVDVRGTKRLAELGEGPGARITVTELES